MTFNSLQYAAFLPLVLLVYWRLRHRGQNVLLLVASYAFYAAWDPRFVGLMLLTTVSDFAVGIGMERSTDDRRRRRLFATSIFLNLAVLGFFKYFDFFADSATALFGTLGLDLPESTLRILLPVGISFYTFHGISYTFDVYRREIAAERNLVTFAVFVAFFPQLVAGPIGRAHLQLEQFRRPRTAPTQDDAASAVLLILQGLVKKVVIADSLAPVANAAFADAGSASGVQLLVGVYAFAFQIYGDFSGYSDIARGSSRLLGVELIRNFEQPYLARTVTEFWRRWHISLSTWLRDYLYLPLGGNRGGAARTYRNLLLVMLLGGLWHGAAWTFVVWGGLHGAFLVAERALRLDRSGTRSAFQLRDVPAAFLTFQLVCVAWIFFRASSLAEAGQVIAGILSMRPGPVTGADVVLVMGALVLAIQLLQRGTGRHEAFVHWRPALQGAVYGTFVVGLLVFSGGAPAPFIYFQF